MKNLTKIFNSYFLITYIYFTVIGGLYLWLYWGYFGINIYEFISLNEIMKLSIYPVIAGSVFVVVGAILGEILRGDSLPDGGGKDTSVGKFLNNARPVFKVLWIVAVIVLFTIKLPSEFLLVLGPFIVGPIWLRRNELSFLVEQIPNERTRSTVVWLLLLLPFYVCYSAKSNANNILNNKKYNFIELNIPATEGTSVPNKKDKLKLLGYVDQNLFLLFNDNKSVVIVKMDKVQPLILHTFPE